MMLVSAEQVLRQSNLHLRKTGQLTELSNDACPSLAFPFLRAQMQSFN